jgi:hypothetical protein
MKSISTSTQLHSPTRVSPSDLHLPTAKLPRVHHLHQRSHHHVDYRPASYPILQAVPLSALPPGASIYNSNPSSRPILPASFCANQPKTIRLYPLSNYTFGTKENQPEEDPSVLARLHRLQEHYEVHGMRRTCEGVLVCHEHSHPHILMLQIANAFFKLYVSFFLQLVFFTDSIDL